MKVYFTRTSLLATMIAGATALTPVAAQDHWAGGDPVFPDIEAVAVDPLQNIFRDEKVEGTADATADSARGEHATFQIVVPPSPVGIHDLQCLVEDFQLKDGNAAAATIPATKVRYVGYVGASYTARNAAKDQLRRAPAMFPDPLLDDAKIDVHAGDNQPVWISVKVPEDITPGDYVSTAVVTGRILGRDTTATVPLNLKVYPATIKDTRLNVVMWHQMWHRQEFEMPEKFSEEYWDLLRAYVRTMVEHRQNWARVETLWLLEYSKDANGQYEFGFQHFDRWVEILLEEGIENIEGLQFAWRSGAWHDPYHVEIHEAGDNFTSGTKVPADSPEAENFYSQLFPALHTHLKEKGWLDRYVQHIGDEPVAGNADSYTTAAQLLKKNAPGIPIMEACLDHNLVGTIDIWVPILQNLQKEYDFFQERKKAGDRVWFYTCLNPQGEYANRFIELPLIKTRLLHWINYRYEIEGYLHWGLNFWRKYPWENVSSAQLPAGDTHIIYPKKDGLGFVTSIRYEAMRDGIEDHELLSQLGEKDPEAAMDFAKKHILDWDKYNTDIEAFRATRRALLEAVSKQSQ